MIAKVRDIEKVRVRSGNMVMFRDRRYGCSYILKRLGLGTGGLV